MARSFPPTQVKAGKLQRPEFGDVNIQYVSTMKTIFASFKTELFHAKE